MRAPSSCLRLVITGAVASAPLVAQTTSYDPLLAMPVMCIVDDATFDGKGNKLDPKRIYLKRSGFVPVGEPTNGAPDFRFAMMFYDRQKSTTPGAVVPDIQIDALSGGLDQINISLIPVGPTKVARVNVPADRWSGLLFSVSRGGSGAGGVVGEEQKKGDAAADIFSLLYAASAARLPSAYRTCATTHCTVRRVSDSGDIGLRSPSHPEGNIMAIDAHLPAYLLDEGIRARLPSKPRVFFSVTNGSLAAVPISWWGTAPLRFRSGATVLFTEWDGTQWSDPRPAVPFANLDCVQADDVDGLSVRYDYGVAGSAEIIFSTTVQSGKIITSDLMYKAVNTAVVIDDAAPVQDSDGGDAADRTGTNSGTTKVNVTAVCSDDPSDDLQCTPSLLWSYVFGTPDGDPVFPTGLVPRQLFSSVFRDLPGGTPSLTSHMVGWTAKGPANGVGISVWMLGSRDTQFRDSSLVNWVLRPSSQPFDGAVSDSLTLPSWVLRGDPTRCLYAWQFWLAFTETSPGVYEFAQSYPVRIRL